MEKMDLTTPVEALKGVGEVKKQKLHRAGIFTVGDLILHFPRCYRSGTLSPLSSDKLGQYGVFRLTCCAAPYVFTMAGGRRVLRFPAEDEAGTKVNILYINQPYLKNKITKGDVCYYCGELQEKNGQFFLFSPERRDEAPNPDLPEPVYPTLGGISSAQIAKLIASCLVPLLPCIRETLPQWILEKHKLLGRARAIFTLHAPDCNESLARAKDRFAFEGLFDFSVKATLFSRRQELVQTPALKDVSLDPFLSKLPFSLTEAQRRVLNEIRADLVGEGLIPAMNRLIQGDVGSGKTVVAAAAAYLVAKNHKSTLLMAPTEILARQHYASFQKLFSQSEIPVLLLTGSSTKKERQAIFEKTLSGKPYILIGTHALTEEGALCSGVGLSITDEQHRFGVRHRSILNEKGGAVHSLVMSATPIPRSLAMFMYAKGKISVIDKLPPGRQVIDTFYVGEDKMQRVYAFLREKAAAGQQAYVVCPLIEDEEEKSPLQSASEEYESLKKNLSELPCALLHGKMKNEEKNAVMASFASGETKILVSTTVIEVGVDVPNATVMVIRNAERFGLSQLHQLRGRVGRGKEKSHCILISSHSGKSARERLRKLCDCHDGFELAKYDLKTRGPGEFFGTRQSGFWGPDLTDEISMPLIESVTQTAEEFLDTAKAEEILPYENRIHLH